MALSLLSYTESLFARRGQKAIDSWITALELLSAFLALSSAMIYGVSAIGILWDLVRYHFHLGASSPSPWPGHLNMG